jgi:hypothetical protein
MVTVEVSGPTVGNDSDWAILATVPAHGYNRPPQDRLAVAGHRRGFVLARCAFAG